MTNSITLKQYETALSLSGEDLTETEYVDHIVIESDTYHFSLMNLDGSERLVKVSDFVNAEGELIN